MEWVDIFQQLTTLNPVLIASGIFLVLLLCGFGLPLPEELVLVFAGYACFLGILPIWLAIGISIAGVFIGMTVLYVAMKLIAWVAGERPAPPKTD